MYAFGTSAACARMASSPAETNRTFRCNLKSCISLVLMAFGLLLSAGMARATTIGVAVGSVGSSAPVGLTQIDPLLSISTPATEFYIPLDSTGHTYGGSGTCGQNGTCADTGTGGNITMILRFDPVTIGSNQLTIKFDDLDLANVNDPSGFFESLQILYSNGT